MMGMRGGPVRHRGGSRIDDGEARRKQVGPSQGGEATGEHTPCPRLALDVVEKSQLHMQGLRDELRGPMEERQKARMGAAELGVRLGASRRATKDLQQQPGVVDTQVCILTSTLSATFIAKHMV